MPSLSLSLQEVGPNPSGDVRGLCQQDTGAWILPPIHPTALDYGAAAILWHSDEEPGAQGGALTSQSGGHLYFGSVPYEFGSQREPWTNSRCYGWTRWPHLCLKNSRPEPKHKPRNRKRLQLVKDFIVVQTVPQCGLCVYEKCAVIDCESNWNDHYNCFTLYTKGFSSDQHYVTFPAKLRDARQQFGWKLPVGI